MGPSNQLTTPKRRKFASKDQDEGWKKVLLVPVLCYLLLFFFYPLISILIKSVFNPGPTLDCYRRILTTPIYLKVLGNTFQISFIVTSVCLVLAYPVSYLITNSSRKVSGVLTFLVVMPIWISLLVRTYAWLVLLQRQGLVNKLFLFLGVIEQPLQLMYNRLGVVVGMTSLLLPFMVFPLVSIMGTIDQNLIKAAHNLGASSWQTFRRVFFPLSFPGVAAGFILVFMMGLGFYITPALMGGKQDLMIAMCIDQQARTILDWGFASALATMLLVITLLMFLVASKWFNLDRIWSGIS